MKFPVAIVRRATTAFRRRLSGVGLPAVDLGEDRFHFRLALFVLRIPPIERA